MTHVKWDFIEWYYNSQSESPYKQRLNHVVITELGTYKRSFQHWIRYTKEITSRAWWYSRAWYWSKNTSKSRNKKNVDAVSGEPLICCPLYWLVMISASSCRRERKDPGRLTWCTTWLIIEVISPRTFSWFCKEHITFISNVTLKWKFKFYIYHSLNSGTEWTAHLILCNTIYSFITTLKAKWRRYLHLLDYTT